MTLTMIMFLTKSKQDYDLNFMDHFKKPDFFELNHFMKRGDLFMSSCYQPN